MSKILTLPHTDSEAPIVLPLGGVLNVRYADNADDLWYPEGFDHGVLCRNGYGHFTEDAREREDAFKGIGQGETVIHYARGSERCSVRVMVA